MPAVPSKNKNQPSTRICIGKIATAHGVRGLVKLHVFADDPQLLNGSLHTAETGDKTLTITPKNSMGKYWLAEVENISDRTMAETLRGTELWIDSTQLPETNSEDEFYINDLIGLSVVNTDKETIGSVKAVENYGAGDLLDITPTNGKSFLLPFTKEYVPEIDISEKRIIVGDITAFLEE